MYLSDEYCYVCKKFTTHHDNECTECEWKKESDKKRKYFSELNCLTLEERIRKIEEWIYNHKCCDKFPLMDK